MPDKAPELTHFLKTLTNCPGVYQMQDAKGDVIYIGKALNLYKRVNSYFQSKDHPPKVLAMVAKVASIEVIVTESENEALLLESNLIKKIRPRYNVVFRDDKSYPYIYLSADDFPRLEMLRGAKKKTGRYFGPYPNGYAAKQTLHLLQKLFQIRHCSDAFFKARSRPCLQHQIKRCTAPCVGLISKADYALSIERSVLFLEGKSDEIIQTFTQKMDEASDNKAYEQAAYYRDMVQRLRRVQQQQAISIGSADVDVLAVEHQAGHFCVHGLFIRDGRLLGSQSYFPKAPKGSDQREVLFAFLQHFYVDPHRIKSIPETIILSELLENTDPVAEVLTEQRGKKVKIVSNVRGVRAKWSQMASKNAQVALAQSMASRESMAHRFESLQSVLGLDNPPVRIECFDISHTGGEETVAACVVFGIEGAFKSDYRRYKLSLDTPGDDYEAMRQVMRRRYEKMVSSEAKLPDILLVDGGKGQIKQAQQVLEQLQIHDILIMGISKGEGRRAENDTLHVVEDDKIHPLKTTEAARFLIQQIRDEAHRFAITGHRARRDKKSKRSTLDDIPGVGDAKRRALLKHFGSVGHLKSVGIDELMKVPGVSKKLAQVIYDHLR